MKKIKNIKLSTNQQKIIILISIFTMMLVLNCLTPLLADDYSYSFGADGKRIKNILDIISMQANHYMLWGGRSVAHSIANFFLMMPKTVFSILNSGVYTLMIYLIYIHAKTEIEEKPIMLILIHLCLYFILPVFGQNCLWLIGSCNYLWTTTIILLFLLEYRENNSKKDSILRVIGMLLLGIISGWTNENTAFGLIIITLLSVIIFKGKKSISKYKISGLIGTIVGFITMIAAPGNFVRSKLFIDNSSTIVKLLKRTIDCTNGIIDYMIVLITIAIVLITIHIYKKQKVDKRVYIYIIGSFFAIYSMVLSPEFPERSWFGVIVYALIADMTLLYKIENINKMYKFIITDIVILLAIIYIGDYLRLTRDIYNFKVTWNYRINTIEEGKKEKINNFLFGTYHTENKKSPAYGLADIGENEHEWPNDAIEKYYKIDSIRRNTE